MAVKVPSAGPSPAKILLVGEAPGKTEEEKGLPFVGASGQEMTKMLNDAGILRTECRVTNTCKFRPPGNKIELWWELHDKGKKKGQIKHIDPRVEEGVAELKNEIETTRPNVVVPLGNLPLWATTGQTGITKWRSSLLRGVFKDGSDYKIIPAIHPAAVLRNWEWRYLDVHDFRRVARWSSFVGYPEIKENFLVDPGYDDVMHTLSNLLHEVEQRPTYLATDVETRKRHLACFGIAWSKYDAISIPLMDTRDPDEHARWTLPQEARIVMLVRELLTHPNARVIGQNWQYDYRYVAKYWGFEVNLFLDIMSEHHVQFPGLPKGLDFQSSLYSDIHIYWKDAGKEQGHGDQIVWWTYNCRDCVRTYECAEVLLKARELRPLKRTKYGSPHEIQQALSLPVARASLRGVRLNHSIRGKLLFMIQADMYEAQQWLNRVLQVENFNCRSNPQMLKLFYEELHLPKILHRKTRRPTLDDEALDTIAKRWIVLRPLCHAINHIRSLGNSMAVCMQSTDSDGRARSQFTIPGTETYRFTSSSDPLGDGGNLQNVSDGSRGDKDFALPNLRKLFIPDPGYTIGELDLPQADARIVAWEAQDQKLIELFSDPTRHLHLENAKTIFGKVPAKSDIEYYYAKQGVHLTNYGGEPMVLAMTLGITLREAQRFNEVWFREHPGIKEWHGRVKMDLMTKRYVENQFGYRRFYYDRIENLLKEALAWIPQSSVAISTNLGILAVDRDVELQRLGVQFLFQVHDSAVFQWPTHLTEEVLPLLLKRMTIEVPYEKPGPLVFTPGVKISEESWGDMRAV